MPRAARRSPPAGPPLRLPRLPQQREPLRQFRRRVLGDHLGERLRIGARADDAILGALELRRGNQLHRLRDFLRVLNGANAPLQLARFGHYSALYSSIALRSRALRSSDSARLSFDEVRMLR